jgi:hypothetical protein
MRYMKWIGLAVAVLMIVSCISPWVFIESKNITVSGIDATGTNFGKPGYFHFIMTAFFLVFNFIPRLWAKRINLVVTALNLGWAIRNYFIISACAAGECPEKKTGIYMMLLASVLMLVSALFPDMEPPQTPPKPARPSRSDGEGI